MTIYEIRKEIFYSVKPQLDELVFWRESVDDTVYIKVAAPHPGLRDFLRSASIRTLKKEELKLKPLEP
jgi:hypothetical protein